MKTIFSVLLLTSVLLSAQLPPIEGGLPAPSAAGITNAPGTPPQRRQRPDIGRRPTPTLPGLPAGGAPGAGTPIPAPGGPVVLQSPDGTSAAGASGVPAGLPLPNAAGPGQVAAEEAVFPAKYINYTGADLGLVLQKYAELVNRTIIRSPTTEASLKTSIFFVNQTPLTRGEAIQAYQAIFAMNGLSFSEVGEKFLKVVTVAEALGVGQAPMITTNINDLPEMGQFVTHIVQLKYAKPSELQPVLVSFQSGKIPNAIQAVENNNMLVLRDFAENVKRMLEMIEKVDIGAPSEFESEVIPIKFAKAEEIASALSALSGSSSSTTVGQRASGGTSGVGTRPGMGGYNNQLGGGGLNNQGGLNSTGTGTTGTPSAGGSFSDRINQIISRAAKTSGSGDFQIIGPNKIVADVRSNSLMVFASRHDMATIKKIVDQLDVVLAQVLIETVILDVQLNDSYNFGVSYLQRPKTSGDVTGVGGLNNVGFLNGNNFSGLTNGANSLGKGFSYLGQFGQDLDVTLTAAAGDSSVKVIQKPRILTSHATAAQVFIGSTVPYVSGTYYGGGISGASSSYQQLRVGINLSVTPYINGDGLVVMKVDEAIDEISGSVAITGVGDVPTTSSRTISAEVAVPDRETIVLGGFIRSSADDRKSGMPILKDIPVLGWLFNSTSKSKVRSELMVLMRPTVLRTPQLAAAETSNEKSRLPGIRMAEAENARDEAARNKMADRELEANEKKFGRKAPQADVKKNEPGRDDDGFLVPPPVPVPAPETAPQQ